jgi:hypothetical protein
MSFRLNSKIMFVIAYFLKYFFGSPCIQGDAYVVILPRGKSVRPSLMADVLSSCTMFSHRLAYWQNG